MSCHGRYTLAKSRLSFHLRNRARDADAWDGLVGLTWMVAYWATLIPMWVNHVVGVFSAR